ncbi:MAG: HD domain-containing protein [Candidatus Bipolaricaulota bacterium]|nr:MAG: HD domain-containing protein [Candidatus Bipolaricaulota bacterium]
MELSLPTRGNQKLDRVVRRVEGSPRLEALWTASNTMAIDRMGINDHGPVHIKIIVNIALRLLRLLVARGVVPSSVSDHELAHEDAEVIVLLASVLHDIGHVIHREDHEALSLILAPALIDELLEGIYEEPQRTVIEGEILHAIHAHRRDVRPLTIEAGIVKVSDALDMESGRARIPFKAGEQTIHSVSAMAIRKVRIERGDTRPIRIHVEMSNSAGIFQLDTLLRAKLATSGIAEHVEVVGEVIGDEARILDRYTLA